MRLQPVGAGQTGVLAAWNAEAFVALVSSRRLASV
jgi:hypothetical protein